MTSKTSSLGNRYSLRSAFSVGPVVLNIVIFAMIMVYMALAPENIIRNMQFYENFTYTLIPTSMIFYFLLLQAVATPVMMYGFMFNKRAAIMYLSLPVKRSEMFWARYAAGLIMIVTPSLLFMIWQLSVHLQAVGYSAQLMQGFFVLTAAILVMLFTAYSITSAICLCVGTAVEGVVFSLFAMFGAIVLIIGINLNISWCLHGNALIGFYSSSIPDIDYIMVFFPVTSSLTFFNQYGSVYDNTYFNVAFLNQYYYGFYILIIWFVLSIFISYLAYKAFLRYKAENSGVLGVNKVLNFLITFTAVFFVFGYCCTMLEVSTLAGVLIRPLVALLLSFATYFACRFLLTLSMKKAFKGLWQYAVMLTVPFVVFVLCVTGLFGFSTYQPDISEIEGVFFTYTGAPDFLPGGSEHSYYTHSNGTNRQEFEFVREFQYPFTSEEDIQTILELHNELIEMGQDMLYQEKDRMNVRIYVRYMLKSGKWVTRMYKTVPGRILDDMLRLDDTELVKELTGENFDILVDTDDVYAWVSDTLFKNKYRLDAEQAQDLASALRKDIDTLSKQEKYYPEQKAEAVILFPRIETDEYMVSRPYIFLRYDGDAAANIIYDANTHNQMFYITGEYENTLQFLKAAGLLANAAEDISGILEMYVERYPLISSLQTRAPYFRSYETSVYVKHKGSCEIGKENYQDVLDAARSNYYTAGGGYILKVLVQDAEGAEKWTTLFIPEADAPVFVKEIVSN